LARGVVFNCVYIDRSPTEKPKNRKEPKNRKTEIAMAVRFDWTPGSSDGSLISEAPHHYHAEGQIKAYENDVHLNPDTPVTPFGVMSPC
jgi:hypothetical protein